MARAPAPRDWPALSRIQIGSKAVLLALPWLRYDDQRPLARPLARQQQLVRQPASQRPLGSHERSSRPPPAPPASPSSSCRSHSPLLLQSWCIFCRAGLCLQWRGRQLRGRNAGRLSGRADERAGRRAGGGEEPAAAKGRSQRGRLRRRQKLNGSKQISPGRPAPASCNLCTPTRGPKGRRT